MKAIREQIALLRTRASPDPDSPEDQCFFLSEDKDAMEQAASTMEAMLEVVEAAGVFLKAHDEGDDATSELEVLDEALNKLKEIQ